MDFLPCRAVPVSGAPSGSGPGSQRMWAADSINGQSVHEDDDQRIRPNHSMAAWMHRRGQESGGAAWTREPPPEPSAAANSGHGPRAGRPNMPDLGRGAGASTGRAEGDLRQDALPGLECLLSEVRAAGPCHFVLSLSLSLSLSQPSS